MNYETKNLQKQAQAHESDSSINGAKRAFASEAEADVFFERLRHKILDLAAWNTKGALTSFAQFSENGEELKNRALAENNFIRIALKGAGKYDWVRVARIHTAPSEIVVTVKPTFDPTAADRDSTSHFFTSAATNNFCLLKTGAVVMLYVIGLHEKTNLDETASLLEQARNLAAANLGSYLGVQSAEWTIFARNFLELEDEK